MVKKTSVEKSPRLTITLGQGQREALQAIANRNHTTQAFLVRYAIDRFIEEIRQKQLRLDL
jgi:predicted DNA-binding protein